MDPSRLAIRYTWRADMHESFVILGCVLICLNQIKRVFWIPQEPD